MPGGILITGANGYLGASCVERFVRAADRDVIGTWHSRKDQLPAALSSHVHFEQCDLADPAAVTALLDRRRVGTVLHTAALLADGSPGYLSRALRANVVATANLVAAAARVGCSHFVYCSSISVYGAAPCPSDGWKESAPALPTSIYGWSKQAGEECVRLCDGTAGLTRVALRLAGIHGGTRSSGAVFQMMRAALAGEPLNVKNPVDPFQLLFIDDAVEAAFLAIQRANAAAYSVVNVASHVFSSFKEMAQSIVESCQSSSDVQIDFAGASGVQVMNTAHMADLLGFVPGSVDRHLRALQRRLRTQAVK